MAQKRGRDPEDRHKGQLQLVQPGAWGRRDGDVLANTCGDRWRSDQAFHPSGSSQELGLTPCSPEFPRKQSLMQGFVCQWLIGGPQGAEVRGWEEGVREGEVGKGAFTSKYLLQAPAALRLGGPSEEQALRRWDTGVAARA